MKWLDSRVHKPNSNAFHQYPVIFLYEGFLFTGYAGWMPINDYTDGEWINIRCTNTNKLEPAKVLYWTELPKWPENLR